MEYDIPVCRLCLCNDEDAFEIFGEKGVLLDVASILSRHFWFEVAKDDSLSQIVCTECWRRVESFHELYLKVERKYKSVYEDLRQSPNISDSESKIVHIKKEAESQEQLISILPVPEFLAEDKISVELYDECEVQIPNAAEELDDIESLDNKIDDTDDDEDFVPNATSGSDSEEEKPLKALIKSAKIRKKVSNNSSRGINIKSERTSIAEKKQRFDSNKDNETVKQYFSMTCDLCGAAFENFLHAKKHHRTTHNQTGYLTCCDKKFFKLYRVMQHCIWHANPEAFKCSECFKCYSDGVGLRDHMDNVHAPAEMRIYACDICPKTFLRRHMLTTHKRIQHVTEKDKKFACEICGQKFVIQAFLHAHIKKVHENADSRVCDICAKFFKCSKSYEIHYMCVHTDVQQKVQCELCGKWLKHKDSLKEHKRRHVATNEKCEFCGRISSNKKALRAHIRSAHTAPAFPCTICNKLFKKRQTLKEHMAIHAGRTDLYSCSFCTKTFRSSANMYAHRKKAHPKEYEENRNCGSKYLKTDVI